MLTNTATAATPKTRRLDRRVESVKRMKNGLRLNLGYDSDAYLADSTREQAGVSEVGVDDRVIGAYLVETGRNGEKFARITRLDKVLSAETGQAEDAQDTTGQTEENEANMTDQKTAPKTQNINHVIHEALSDPPRRHGVEVRLTNPRTGRPYTGMNLYVPRSVVAAVKAGQTIVGIAEERVGRDDKPYLHLVETTSEQPAEADEERQAGRQNESEPTIIEGASASEGLSDNNRFLMNTDDGHKVVVQASGRSVMYAKSIIKKDARVKVTGVFNDGVNGRGDCVYVDASRVEKAA